MPLDRSAQNLQKKVLSSPDTFPEEYVRWLEKKIVGNSAITLERYQIPGPENYITPTMLNGYAAAGGAGLRFYKDLNGIVHVEGQVINVAVNVAGLAAAPIAMFAVPVGYRPRADHKFLVADSVAAPGVITNNLVMISSDGNFYHVNSEGRGTMLPFLTGINWRAEI